MAATEYARGHNITATPVPDEIMMFVLAKEFHWTPQQIKNESAKDINGILTVLSIFNKLQNQQMEKVSKGGKGGGRSKMLRNEEITQFNKSITGKGTKND